MRLSPFTLLTDRDRFWESVNGKTVTWAEVLPLMMFIVL